MVSELAYRPSRVTTIAHRAATGPLHPEITVKYVAVSVIFLNSGLSLKTEVSWL